MAKMKESYIKRMAMYNDRLFEAEIDVENQKRAVSKNRYYLASDPCEINVRNLQGSIAKLRAMEMKLEELRNKMEEELRDIHSGKVFE